MILLHIPDPSASPTGKSPVRLRYSIARDPSPRCVLRYSHGRRILTRADWLALEAIGATIETDNPRDAAQVAEVLGGR